MNGTRRSSFLCHKNRGYVRCGTVLFALLLSGCTCGNSVEPIRIDATPDRILDGITARGTELSPEKRALLATVFGQARPSPRLVTIKTSAEWDTIRIRDRWMSDSEKGSGVLCNVIERVSIDGAQTRLLYEWRERAAVDRFQQLCKCVDASADDLIAARDDATTNPIREWLVYIPRPSERANATIKIVEMNSRLGLSHLAYVVDGAEAASRTGDVGIVLDLDTVRACVSLLGDVSPATLTAAAIDIYDGMGIISSESGKKAAAKTTENAGQ